MKTLEQELMELSFLRVDKSLTLTVFEYYKYSTSGLNHKDTIKYLRIKYREKKDGS